MKSILYSARLCMAAYGDMPGLVHADLMGVVGVSDPETGVDGFVFIARESRTLHIVFRGSESPVQKSGRIDWLNNLMVLKTDFHGIRCHRGVVRCTLSVLDQVTDIIAMYPGWSLTLQGHSAGGNVATLVAVALCDKFAGEPGVQIRLITFGQSRVSSAQALASKLWCDYIRVQNGSDAVCRWPKLGYGDYGTNLYFPNSSRLGAWMINPHIWVQRRDILFSTIGRVLDHRMNEYTDRVARVVEDEAMCGVDAGEGRAASNRNGSFLGGGLHTGPKRADFR